MTAQGHTAWCSDHAWRDLVRGDHECIGEVGETGGRPGERVGVDLIRRAGDTGELDLQVGIVDVATGQGVAVNLDQLDEVLALVARARRRLGGSGRRWAGRSDHRPPSGRRVRTSR